jgi:hypothetical protein
MVTSVYRLSRLLTGQGTGRAYIKKMIIRRIIVCILSFSVFFLSACGQERSNPYPSLDPSTQTPAPSTVIDNGLTAGQNAFSNGCQRIASGNFEGTADVFREAGTMAEEGGDTELARIAYAYAESLDNFDSSQTYSECLNY